MANESELSIEETNKLRISLGLKPLKVDTAPSADATEGPKTYDDTAEGRERQAVDNWKAHEEAAAKDEARRRRAEEIRRAREQAQRFRKLEGKGLADDDDEDMGDAGADAATWLKKQKKRQRKMAEKLARQKEEELEREARERREYTEKDLAGVKVGHDLDEIGGFAGDEVVLTLKDTTIDENEEEGDELISTEIAERERLKERLELKKKKPAYNPYEEAEGGETRILAQYDEDDKKKKRFVLDGTGSLANNETYRQEVAEKLKATAISLDIPKPEVTSDYIDPSTIKVKKPKKKKAKSTRKRGDDEDALNPTAGTPNGEDMELDIKPRVMPRKRIAEDTSFVDDDDLQSALAIQRRTALKKRKILRPDEIARQLREETENAMDEDAPADGEPGLVIDETTEFVSNLRERASPKRPSRPRSVSVAAADRMDDDVNVEVKDEYDKDIDMIRDERSRSVSIKPEPSPAPEQNLSTITGLDEEATITGGVGATVAMLTKRGLINRDPEAEKKLLLEREKNLFLLEKRQAEMLAEKRAKEARAHDRESGKFERMSAREREEHARRENKHRDFVEARQMADRFKDYKPNIELHYTDEFGREMNQKEAFKYLSHQFHGKGSGKMKTEKRLKKIEDEKKREAASHLGTGQSDTAAQSAAKRSKQAGVRLM